LVLEEKTIGAVARELDLTAALRLWVEHVRVEQTKGKSGLMKEERGELARRSLLAYNIIKIHSTLPVRPAMAAGVAARLLDVMDLVNLIESDRKKRPSC
jgi:hypothetical protein